MNVIFLLLIILFALMVIIGGERGLKSFFTLVINFVMLLIMLKLIEFNLDPIKVTVIGSIIISSVTLFYINGINKKTISSLLSVILVVLLTLLITYKIGSAAKIQGFGNEQSETLSSLSLYVQLNFPKVVLCQILIGLLGAIIDVSISISSSMNEIRENHSYITKNDLIRSGISIGKDILGTMTNTLLFAYIGGFMSLIIWFNKLNYSVFEILNAKVFCSEVFQILCGGIGIILIIPTTALITSIVLFLDTKSRRKMCFSSLPKNPAKL